MALVPWPITANSQARAAAIKTLQLAVGGATLGVINPIVDGAHLLTEQEHAAAIEARANAIGSAAAARVQAYAPGAPQAIKDEACIRFAGYLAQSDYGTIKKEDEGPRSVEYNLNHSAMFRNCGAAALLSPWKVRRAGAVQ